MFSSEEALIVVVRFLLVDFPVSIGSYVGSDCRRIYFLRFSGFLWAIDGPTNAAAIDPLINVAVPSCLELVSLLGMTLDLNYEVASFFWSLQLFV